MKCKNSLLVTLAVVIIALSFHETPAQRKLLTLSEYSEGTLPPPAKSQELTRRNKGIEETFVGGVLMKTVETISESVISGGNRFYSKTTEGDKITEIDKINVNDVMYIRENGKAWRKESDNPFGRLVMGGGLSSPPPGKQYSVESVFLNGISTQIFEAFFVLDKGKELTFQEVRMWVGQDGLVYRQELVEGKLFPRTETLRSVSTYDYDPNIKVEAPMK
ncbi:MAG: hypothetical protein ABIP78_11685 [Pyrinomonadaceae bacterium]